MAKPTVHDLAREAGVSLATVDRVLNARPGVRIATIERVQAAIDRLGFVRDLSAANLARRRQYRFAALLPAGASEFVSSLRHGLVEAANAAERTSVRVIGVPAHDPHAVVKVLAGLRPVQVDGLALMIPETPQVRDAVARLKAEGLPVVTLVSDLPNSGRDHFVGIDSRAAGRTAGFLMSRLLPERRGRVLIVSNSMLARDSLERRLGFDEAIGEEAPGVEVLPSIEAHDDPERMAETVATSLSVHRGVAGVYSLGSASAALLSALRRVGATGLVVIVHELTQVTREALLRREIDAVITQNVGHLARSTLRVLRAKCDGVGIVEAQERIRIEIVVRENLP